MFYLALVASGAIGTICRLVRRASPWVRTAERPNQRYVGYITYLPIGDGANPYLATIIDLYSRKLAGWSIADHMRSSLVTDTLKAAARGRDEGLDEAVFHSDHGAHPQYASHELARVCTELGVVQSMAPSAPAPTTPWPKASTRP